MEPHIYSTLAVVSAVMVIVVVTFMVVLGICYQSRRTQRKPRDAGTWAGTRPISDAV